MDFRTIILADDHPLILSGLKHELGKDPSYKIVGEAQDGLIAMDLIIYHKPKLCILDVQMPKMTGLEVAKEMQNLQLGTSVILMTMMHDLSFLEQAKLYGVKGYLLKDSVMDEVHNCLEDVRLGKEYFSHSIETLQHEMDEKLRPLQSLSRMEKKIFRLVGEGMTTNKISKLLFISPKTVENHRYNISKKLNLSEKNTTLIKFSREFL